MKGSPRLRIIWFLMGLMETFIVFTVQFQQPTSVPIATFSTYRAYEPLPLRILVFSFEHPPFYQVNLSDGWSPAMKRTKALRAVHTHIHTRSHTTSFIRHFQLFHVWVEVHTQINNLPEFISFAAIGWQILSLWYSQWRWAFTQHVACQCLYVSSQLFPFFLSLHSLS